MSFRPVIAGMVNVSGGAGSVAAITSGTITGLTTFALRNAGTGAYDLTLACNGTMTAGRALTIDPGNAAQSLIFTGASTITFPSGTATLAKLGANTFTGIQTLAGIADALYYPTGGGGSNYIINVAGFKVRDDGRVEFPNAFNSVALGTELTDAKIGASSYASIGFASSAAVTTALDTYFTRHAAGFLTQRDTTNDQTFAVANTWTSATNYEFGVLDWQGSANVFRIGTQKGSGGGTARDMVFITDDTERFRITSTGGIILPALPTSDPGVSGQLYKSAGVVMQSA